MVKLFARLRERVPAPALFALGAALGTALLQSDLKTLRSLGYTIEFLLFLRYAGSFMLSVVYVLLRVRTEPGTKWGLLARFKPVKLSEQLLRGTLMLGTTLGVFIGTKFLLVAQLGAISPATWPLLALLFAPSFGERLSKPLWVAASSAASLAGLGILLAAAGVGDAARFAIGTGWVCLASVCTALNQHLNRRANQRGENQYVSMFFQSLLGFVATSTLWVTPIASFRKIEFDPGMVRPGHLPWLVLVAVLGFLPQLWYFLAARAPVTTTTPIAVVQAPFGAALDYQREGTVPDLMGVLGLGAMLIGVGLAWPAIFAQAKARTRQ
jgi:drug/metabolite transporter (DMT)-like permease